MAGLSGDDALNLAKSYVRKTLQGQGALKGQDGKSAYQVAVDNGFEGTEQEWLESLKSGSIEISKEENNALEEKEDGLYVPASEKALGLNGGTLNNGARINIPSSENGVGALIDGSYITIDNAGTNKSSTITADGIDTPSLIVNGNDVLTVGGGDMNANSYLKFKGNNNNTYTEIYQNGVEIYDNSGNSTFVASDIIETPEIITKKVTVDGNDTIHTGNIGDYALSLNGGSFNKNPQITIPSTDGHAWIGIMDNGYATNITADIIHIVNTNDSKDTMIEAGGISTPSLTVSGKEVRGTGFEKYSITTDNSVISIGEVTVSLCDMGDFVIVNIDGSFETSGSTKVTLPITHNTYNSSNYTASNNTFWVWDGTNANSPTLGTLVMTSYGMNLVLNNTQGVAIRIIGTLVIYTK